MTENDGKEIYETSSECVRAYVSIFVSIALSLFDVFFWCVL